MAGVNALIKGNHHRLEGWFAKVESEPDDGWVFFERVAGLLIPRSRADERVVYPAITAAGCGGGADLGGGIAERSCVEESPHDLHAGDPEVAGGDGLIAAMIGGIRYRVEEVEEDIVLWSARARSNRQLLGLGAHCAAANQKAFAYLKAIR